MGHLSATVEAHRCTSKRCLQGGLPQSSATRTFASDLLARMAGRPTKAVGQAAAVAAAAVAQRARDAQAAAVARSSAKYGLLLDEESEEEEAAQRPAPTTVALPPRPPKGKKLRASKVRVLSVRGVRQCRLVAQLPSR